MSDRGGEIFEVRPGPAGEPSDLDAVEPPGSDPLMTEVARLSPDDVLDVAFEVRPTKHADADEVSTVFVHARREDISGLEADLMQHNPYVVWYPVTFRTVDEVRDENAFLFEGELDEEEGDG